MDTIALTSIDRTESFSIYNQGIDRSSTSILGEMMLWPQAIVGASGPVETTLFRFQASQSTE